MKLMMVVLMFTLLTLARSSDLPSCPSQVICVYDGLAMYQTGDIQQTPLGYTLHKYSHGSGEHVVWINCE